MGKVASVAMLTMAVMVVGCHQVNDDRIPHMPVNIQLDSAGLWNVYGVTGFGMHRRFILYQGIVEPAGFAYKYGSATGFGGVLLISGQNQFSGEIGPLAYDLACPVERSPDVRVEVDDATMEAVCHHCGSHYNVVDAGGVPVSGPARASNYALRRYECVPGGYGGYIITD